MYQFFLVKVVSLSICSQYEREYTSMHAEQTCHLGGVRVIPWELGVHLESPHQFAEVGALTINVTDVKKRVC